MLSPGSSPSAPVVVVGGAGTPRIPGPAERSTAAVSAEVGEPDSFEWTTTKHPSSAGGPDHDIPNSAFDHTSTNEWV